MRHSLLLVCLLVSLPASPDTFERWKTSWDEGNRTAVVTAYKKRVQTEGVQPVYADLQQQVDAIPATNDEELRWKRSFSCAMVANLAPLPTTKMNVSEALQLSDEGEISSATTKKLLEASEADRLLRGDPFPPDDAGLRPEYRLLNQSHAHLDAQCPDHEIAFRGDSTSVTARELYRIADILTVSLQNTRLPLMEATAATISDSRARWEAFFKHAMLDQFPWETYANEWGRHHFAPLRGTLRQPPAAQLRIAHPTPVVVIDDSGGTSFEPSLGVEALGWRAYDTTSYEPRWGVSLLGVLKTEHQDSMGYGLLFVARSFSFGAIVRDTERASNDVQVMLGVDIARLFRNSSSAAEARESELNEAWQTLISCAGKGFDPCASP